MQEQIQRIRNDEEVGIRYMNRWEEEMEWREEGREEGIEQGQDRMQTLYIALERDGRLSEYGQAMRDRELRDKLLKEYGLIQTDLQAE